MVEPELNSVSPSAASCIGSVGCTTPTLASWPFSLDTVPSPAMLICVSAGDSVIGCPLLSNTALPALLAIVPSGIRPKRPSRVRRGPRAVLTVKYPSLGDAEIERIVGMRQRARAQVAPGRTVLRIRDAAVALRHVGAVLPTEPVAELHALGLEAWRARVRDVVRDHVHHTLLCD